MTYSDLDAPKATCWSIEGIVEHKGNQYKFWAEWEMLMDEVSYEFTDGEPSDSFNFSQFEEDCRAMLENYSQFCEDNNLKEHYALGEQ